MGDLNIYEMPFDNKNASFRQTKTDVFNNTINNLLP